MPKFLPMKAKWYKPVRRCCVWMTPVFALTPEKARPISWRSKHGMSLIPVVVVFILLQRRIMSNMGGAVKG